MQTKLSISAERLYQSLRIALTCASNDETRPSRNQVRLAFGEKRFVAQATDGHRAVEVSTNIAYLVDYLGVGVCEHLVSVDVAQQLVAMLKPHVKQQRMVDVTVDAKSATFSVLGQSIVSSASILDFPPLHAVVKLPDEDESAARAYGINPSYLADIAKAVGYVSKKAGVECLGVGGDLDPRFYASDVDDYAMRWVIMPMRLTDEPTTSFSRFAWTVNPAGMRTERKVDTLSATN